MEDPDHSNRDPAEAFDEMRGEVALLRRAIEALTAERKTALDYSETLGAMDGRLRRIAHNIVLIAKHPAMQMTPETMGQRMTEAARAAREMDRATIEMAQTLQRKAYADLINATGTVRAKWEQRQNILYTGVATALAVSLLWLVYPGWAAGIGPQGWLWPESVARRSMGEPTLWDAGIRLMRAGNPTAWQAIVEAADVTRENREAIGACERAAAKAKEPVKCTFRIKDPSR